jgi:transposase
MGHQLQTDRITPKKPIYRLPVLRVPDLHLSRRHFEFLRHPRAIAEAVKQEFLISKALEVRTQPDALLGYVLPAIVIAFQRLDLLEAWHRHISSAGTQSTKATRLFVASMRSRGVKISISNLYAWDSSFTSKGIVGLLCHAGPGRPPKASERDRKIIAELAALGGDAESVRQYYLAIQQVIAPNDSPMSLRAVRRILSECPTASPRKNGK